MATAVETPAAKRPRAHSAIIPGAPVPMVCSASASGAASLCSDPTAARATIALYAGASPCIGCLARVPRRRWREQDCITQPFGVYEFRHQSQTTQRRWHAVYAIGHRGQLFAGCYGSKEAAARAWDDVARAAGRQAVNQPKLSGETPLAEYMRKQIEDTRAAQFPYLPEAIEWRRQELHCMMQTDAESAVLTSGASGTLLHQEAHDTAAGNQLCWSFQRHSADVRKTAASRGRMTRSRPSAMDTFNDLALRAKCVRSCAEYRGDFSISRFTLHGELHFLQGSWILNFQPRVAAAIYEAYAGVASGAVVYDSSAGWGGRLLGALLAQNVGRYIGCEPSTKTYVGLEALRRFVLSEKPATMDKQLELHNVGSEIFELASETVDVAFTSPPYFCLERYADEPTQSHIKFPSFPAWRDGFLQPTLAHTFNALKKGGACLVNISNNRDLLSCGADLEAATIRIAKDIGATHEATLRLLKLDGNADAGEPVFVLRKAIGNQDA